MTRRLWSLTRFTREGYGLGVECVKEVELSVDRLEPRLFVRGHSCSHGCPGMVSRCSRWAQESFPFEHHGKAGVVAIVQGQESSGFSTSAESNLLKG